MTHRVFLSLGSNMGDRLNYLNDAIALIRETDGFRLVQTSSFYETDPVGYLDQDPFLNCVVEISTDNEPYAVLEHCMEIEQRLDRKRIIRWGPRTIDVDVLLYDDLEMNDEALTIPHPRMHERAFVLVPLAEIWKDGLLRNKALNAYINELSCDGIRKMSNEK